MLTLRRRLRGLPSRLLASVGVVTVLSVLILTRRAIRSLCVWAHMCERSTVSGLYPPPLFLRHFPRAMRQCLLRCPFLRLSTRVTRRLGILHAVKECRGSLIGGMY